MGEGRAFIIAHSTGEGISELFCALGADSTLLCESREDFSSMLCESISSNPAEKIIILPATHEAFAEAELLVRRECGKEIYLVPSRTIGEAYAALVQVSREATAHEQAHQAGESVESVASAEIVLSEQSLVSCKYSALSGGKIIASSGSAEGAALLALDHLVGDEKRIITLFVGRNVSNSCRVFLTERLMEIYPEMQIIVYIGGQNTSEYYIALR